MKRTSANRPSWNNSMQTSSRTTRTNWNSAICSNANWSYRSLFAMQPGRWGLSRKKRQNHPQPGKKMKIKCKSTTATHTLALASMRSVQMQPIKGPLITPPPVPAMTNLVVNTQLVTDKFEPCFTQLELVISKWDVYVGLIHSTIEHVSKPPIPTPVPKENSIREQSEESMYTNHSLKDAPIILPDLIFGCDIPEAMQYSDKKITLSFCPHLNTVGIREKKELGLMRKNEYPYHM